MDFTQRLVRAAGATDARLADILGQKAEMREADSHIPARLRDAMAHAALGGGKRFRPLLMLESAALFGLTPDAAIDCAAALECVHCYSLAHDDLPAMDNDDMRRGRPTVWTAFDEWTAILAGNALLTLAFELLASERVHANAAVRLDLISTLAKASGGAGMVGGQALDLAAEKLGEPAVATLGHVARIQAMKTGALITFAAEAGAILGQASAEHRAALRRYGDNLGLAFQIADDLLDAEGDAATVGKAVAKDAAAGKATLVSLLGIEAARIKLAETEAAAIAALAPFGARADALRDAARFVVNRKA